MRYLSQIFAPTNNRRLNELIGFLLCVSALLLFLALASYSPLDPSFNSASVLTGSRAARNWIGVVGAMISDLVLQGFGIGAFLLPIFAAVLGVRWFRSRKDCVADRQSAGRNLAGDVRPCAAGVVAGPRALDGSNSDRRSIWQNRRRFPDPLFQSGWRLHRLRQRSGGGSLSLDRVFFLCAAGCGLPRVLLSPLRYGIAGKIGKDARNKRRMQKELEKRRAAPKPVITTQMVPATSHNAGTSVASAGHGTSANRH